MKNDTASSRFWPWSLLWATLFALAHTQSPEYFSNQHHYYLHGFARAGYGHLNEDWLSNTKDPTPVYSWLVARIYSTTGPFTFHIIHFLLLVVYFESVRRIIAALPGFPSRGPAHILFLTLFILVHAAILRVASVRLLGADYPWFLQAGLAAQYMLGPGLQPSAFGVLLMASLAAFVSRRPVLAATLAGITAVIHSTYLLPAGLMTLGYMIVLVREGRWRTGIVAGALALVIVLPIVIFNAQTFLAGDEQTQREAQRIFAHVRIPHHTLVERWFDWVAVVQITIMTIGLILVHRTRVFFVLLIPTIGAAILSAIQIVTESDSLALLFPWRFSVLLMPLTVAIILAKLAMLAVGRVERSPVITWTSAIVASLLAAAGVLVMVLGLGYYTNDAELPLLRHIREHKKRGEVYLIPVKFPTLKKESPASASKTFAPPVRVGAVGIPVDLQRFRLSTGAPIYIDFKAPPYAPAEVIEWHERMVNAERWFKERDWDASGVIDEVRKAGVTHVIVAADKDVKSSQLKLEFSDESYRLYRVTPR